ncbi:MAG: nucleotidyltransferase domain-containing protein [Deltaproteobacteria bacterium]|nr:nucleotidyltransferase domain-containing protein [Deltaproteobacteria bacterium]
METKDKNTLIAKKIITEEVEHAGYKVDRIILFGSRARGDFKKDSDYDFLIVLKQNISHNDESALLLKIRRQMAKLKIDNDTLISSSDRLQEDNNVGNITYYALKHGVSV